VIERLHRWLDESVPVLRIEIIRIFAPLFILGFLSSRIAHADEWLGAAGFRVPELAKHGDYRQPLYIPALPDGGAWAIAICIVASSLLVSIGLRTRVAAAVLGACGIYVALSDRLASFTVTKLTPAIALGLAVSTAGSHLGVDAWLKRRREQKESAQSVGEAGAMRFFQILIPVFYMSSGICKMRGDWLHHPRVLFTHLHDSYQTAFAHLLATTFPSGAWTALQWAVLILETGAPIWFSVRRTRPVALALALIMHAMIGSMFWPVRWFALLMMTLLIASFFSAQRLLQLSAKLSDRYGAW
jgi:hypothetical protein